MGPAPTGPRALLGPRRVLPPAVVDAALLAWPLALWAVFRQRPPWGDERHFLPTVRMFGSGLSLHLLRHYPEMTAPLAYILYAAWGHVVGFTTPALRLLSPLIAGAVGMTWWAVLRREIGVGAAAVLALACVILNPYFVGLSMFVFTDMLALLGLAATVHGVQARRAWVTALGVAVATTTRQYLAFLVPALMAVALVEPPGARRSRLLSAALLGSMPLALLVALWGGHLTPANHLRALFLRDGLRFDLHALALYLAVPAVYLAPLVLPLARTSGRRSWAAGALAAAAVWWWPVRPSPAQARLGHFTVGFLHEALVAAVPGAIATLVLAAAAGVTVAALIACGRQLRAERGAGCLPPATLLCATGTVSFLVVMPFSYMPWEKYALPLIMLLGALAARTLARGRAPIRAWAP